MTERPLREPIQHDISVRAHQPGDAAAYARFWERAHTLWPDGDRFHARPLTTDMVALRQRLNATTNLWLAFVGDQIGAICRVEPDAEVDDVYYVGILSGHPDYLRLGLARRLLCRAVQEAYDAGVRRLDLHTWHGNEQAVPLYKRGGFHWEKDRGDRFENSLPSLLRVQAIAAWFGPEGPFAPLPHPLTTAAEKELGGEARPGAQPASGSEATVDESDDRPAWYRTYQRDIELGPDAEEQGDAATATYRFARDGRQLTARIQRGKDTLFLLERDDMRAELDVSHLTATTGQPCQVTLCVENRGATPQQLVVMMRLEHLLVDGEPTPMALTLAPAQSWRVAMEVHLAGAEDGVVTADLRLGSTPLTLVRHIATKPLFEASLFESEFATGVPMHTQLTLKDNREQGGDGRLRLIPEPGLRVKVDLPALAAGAETSAPITLSAERAGAYTIAMEARDVGGALVEHAVKPVRVFACGPLDCLAVQGDEPTIANAFVRLAFNRTKDMLKLTPRGDKPSIEQRFRATHPYRTPHAPTELTAEATSDGQSAVLRWRLRPAAHPLLLVEGEAHLNAGSPLVSQRFRLTNLGEQPIDLLEPWLRLTPNLAWGFCDITYTLPTVNGVRTITELDWEEEANGVLANEQWLIAETSGLRVAALWTDQWTGRARRYENTPWLGQTLGDVLPGRTISLDPVLLWLDCPAWGVVREQWARFNNRRVERERAQIGVYGWGAAPAGAVVSAPVIALADGASDVSIMLSSLLARDANGRVRLEAPAGWTVTPVEREVRGLWHGQPWLGAFRIDPGDTRPGAVIGALHMRGAWRDTTVSAPFLRLGGPGRVGVQREVREGHDVWIVSNGPLSYVVAPAFAGTVVSLRWQGEERLFSLFPQAGPYVWNHPFHGGIHPTVEHELTAPSITVPSIVFAAQEAEHPDDWGAHWRGVRLTGQIARGKLKGCTLSVAYLTLPASPVLMVLSTIEADTAPRRVAHVLNAALRRPRGSQLTWERSGIERRVHQQHEYCEYNEVNGWSALELDDATLSLLPGQAGQRAWMFHGGRGATELATSHALEVMPGQLAVSRSYFVCARSVEEVRAWREGMTR